jgi:carbonic anhydrase
MSIHRKPIGERIDWLYDVARRYSAAYCDPEASMARERHRARHPTAIAVLKCMDGRINIPIATNTPPGIIQPFRNLGASSTWAGRTWARCSNTTCTTGCAVSGC